LEERQYCFFVKEQFATEIKASRLRMEWVHVVFFVAMSSEMETQARQLSLRQTTMEEANEPLGIRMLGAADHP